MSSYWKNISMKKRKKVLGTEYALLRQAHKQASRELSGGSILISNRAFRD